MVRRLLGLVASNTAVNRFLFESVYEGLALVSDIKTTDYLQYQLDLEIRGSVYRTTIYIGIVVMISLLFWIRKEMRGKPLRDVL